MTGASAPASRRDPARPCRRVRFRSRKPASLQMPGRASGPTGIAAHGRTGPIPGRVRSDPTAPVRDAARPRDPRLDAGEILPRQPRPQSPRIEIERERPGRGDVGRDPRIRPEPQAPMVVRPTQVPQQLEERRPRREADLPRLRMEPRMERRDAPAFQPQPMPRMQEAVPSGARLPRAAATGAAAAHAAAAGPSRARSLRRRASRRRQYRALPARTALRRGRGPLTPIQKRRSRQAPALCFRESG